MQARPLSLALLLGAAASGAVAAERPVVVELFTSEGCSSCPPADALLTEFARGRPDVLPLAFHVTYWNALGWRDPFSLEAATQRQGRYGVRFGDGSYTPEMVVDGVKGFVGSDREAALAAIAHGGRTAAPVTLAGAQGGVTVSIGQGQGRGRVLLVGFDHEHRTPVGRGENAGRMLTESNIVRAIATVGTWSGAPITIHALRPAGQDAAALIEAPSGAIVGAARLRPSL